MKALPLFIALCVTAVLSSSFQGRQNPVTLSYELEYLENNELNVVVTADLEAGWHIYGLSPKENGPIPSKLAIHDTILYTPVDSSFSRSNAIFTIDAAFGIELEYYEGQAVFVQKVRLNQPVEELLFTFEYQVCDDWTCLKPEWLDQSLFVKKGFYQATDKKLQLDK